MQFQIEKLVYGGDGLTRLPADAKGRGKAVFVPFTLPDECVEAKVVESRSGFVRAKLERVVIASPERVHPVCEYFGRCGGCHYQHIDYAAQLRFKADVLRETLRRTAKVDLEHEIRMHGSEPWGYRNRTRMRIKHEPKFGLGYHRYNSHELFTVQHCPISSPLINRAIASIWSIGREGGVPNMVHGVQFFANHDDRSLLAEIYVHPGSTAKDCIGVASKLRTLLPAVEGVVVFADSPVEDEPRKPNPTGVEHSGVYDEFGSNHLAYEVAGHRYSVSGGSFFQTNRFLIDKLAHIVTGGCMGRTALDLYAGVGLFTLSLATSFENVIAVEASPRSFSDLRANIPAHVMPIQTTVEKFLAENVPKLEVELVVVDPPRVGLGEKTAQALGHISVSRVIYVSCDPATLSRDLRVLLGCGFRVEQIHLIDLFPQTYHIETVLQLVR